MKVFEANAGIVKNTVLVEMENVNALFHYGTLCALRIWTKGKGQQGAEYFKQRDGKASSPTTGRAINQFLDKWGNGLEQVQEKGDESTLRDIFYRAIAPPMEEGLVYSGDFTTDRATIDRQEVRLKQKKTSDLVYGVEEYQDDPNFQDRLK